jgi:hypothetical protein
MTYIKDDQVLEEADQFIYEEDIYLGFPDRWELYRSKLYASKKPIYRPNSRVPSENHGYQVQRYWELIGAPKKYLIEEGFKVQL